MVMVVRVLSLARFQQHIEDKGMGERGFQSCPQGSEPWQEPFPLELSAAAISHASSFSLAVIGRVCWYILVHPGQDVP